VSGDEGRIARVVADADVLAADLLAGGPAREALDHVRRHSWVRLLASDPLLDDAAAVIADLADPDLAADWRARIEALRTPVEHPAGDHPGLATAYRGDAGHLLTLDGDLRSVETNLGVQPHLDLSVRSPDSFARLFDPERVYPAVEGGEYPGPDRDPRD
jgi:predicted nucleic acid-binding protein